MTIVSDTHSTIDFISVLLGVPMVISAIYLCKKIPDDLHVFVSENDVNPRSEEIAEDEVVLCTQS